MDAVFINGPFLPGFSRESRSPAVTKSGTLYYPAWLAYACGLAEKNGFKCRLIDSIADKIDFEKSVELVKKSNPKVIVIGTSTPSIEADLEFCAAIKNNLPNVITTLVGTHASALASEIIVNHKYVNIIARREYDNTILNLLTKLSNGLDWRSIDGITFLDNDNVIENKDAEYILDLDSLPFVSEVYSRHLKLENYFYGHVRYPMVSIFTSRGCNARCSYCLYPQTMFGNFRERSPKSIADEFQWVASHLPKVKEILIDDDTFTMNKAHARSVSEELIKINNKLPWTCEARGNLDYDTLYAMKKAGCRLIVTGFESVSQTVLNNVNKNIKMKEVDAFVDAAERVGLKIHACFMAGNPGDTIETLNETLNWALSKKCFDTAQFFPLQVYPGTKAYTEAIDNNFLKKQKFRDWITTSGMHNMTIIRNDRGLTYQQCLDFCDDARRKFYLRPSFIFSKLISGILNPSELQKNIKGFLKIYKYLFKKVSSNV